MTFVLVHGAWHGGWCWRDVSALLRKGGHQVHAPSLTGLGERKHLGGGRVDLDTHIQDVVGLIEMEDLRDVVLVGHSYGGMVITGVADRVPDRIRRLVYLDAFIPRDGESMMGLVGTRGADLSAMSKDGYIVPKWVGANEPPPHDEPQSLKTITDAIVLKNPAARALDATYILTVEQGTRPENDEFYPQSLRAKANGWPVLTLTANHNAQWSAPEALAAMLAEVARAPAHKQ
ncbi:MAG TPA: alpha/beta fold hydrolase [Steroidobacteraceae bacterium]|nr:alpha/beta fold hydrolase [Steroidobacteraceae bacterium]